MYPSSWALRPKGGCSRMAGKPERQISSTYWSIVTLVYPSIGVRAEGS